MNYYDNTEYVSVSQIKRLWRNKQGLPDLQPYAKNLAFGRAVDTILTEPNGIDKAEIINDDVLRCVEAYQNRKIVIHNPKFQHEFYGVRFGVKVKGKIDLMNKHLKAGEDIKTTSATSLKQCYNVIDEFDYDMQATAYMEMFKLNLFIFSFLPKTEKICFQIVMLRSSKMFHNGLDKWLNGLYEHRLMRG